MSYRNKDSITCTVSLGGNNGWVVSEETRWPVMQAQSDNGESVRVFLITSDWFIPKSEFTSSLYTLGFTWLRELETPEYNGFNSSGRLSLSHTEEVLTWHSGTDMAAACSQGPRIHLRLSFYHGPPFSNSPHAPE